MDENEVYMEECTEFGHMQENQTERAGKMCAHLCTAVEPGRRFHSLD